MPPIPFTSSTIPSSDTGPERHLTSIRSCMRPPQRSIYGTPGSSYLFPLYMSLGVPLERVCGFVLGHQEPFFRFLSVNLLVRTQRFVGGRLSDASWKHAG
jgi:hypothetical protein